VDVLNELVKINLGIHPETIFFSWEKYRWNDGKTLWSDNEWAIIESEFERDGLTVVKLNYILNLLMI
jgi:hypothetical protein